MQIISQYTNEYCGKKETIYFSDGDNRSRSICKSGYNHIHHKYRMQKLESINTTQESNAGKNSWASCIIFAETQRYQYFQNLEYLFAIRKRC